MSPIPQARSTAPRAAPLVPDRHPGGAALPIYTVAKYALYALTAAVGAMAAVILPITGNWPL